MIAPRMSNAFARRHGLNPKDDPSLVLQKMSSTGLQLVGGSEATNGVAISKPEDLVQKPVAHEDVLPWGIHPKADPILMSGSHSVSYP